MAFRVDLNTRENFLSTAESRDSILRLANMLGYAPKRNIPASGLMKVTSMSTTEPLVDATGLSIQNTEIFYPGSKKELDLLLKNNYKSIAKKLTQELISYFEISQFDKILLEVRESNEAAVNLYQSFGFKQYGVRKNYYVNEDAKLFQREKIYA